jgi:hypothetical protein
MAKRRRRKNKGCLLTATRKNGKKVRANARVSMPLKALRRLLGAARRGEKAVVKAVVR